MESAPMDSTMRSKRRDRRHLAVPDKTDASTSRSSGGLTSYSNETKMETPHSFHGVLPLAVKQSSSKAKRTSKSFDDAARCSSYEDLKSVGLKDDSCPKRAIQLMKIAAKTLERRAAELELERKEKESEEKAKRKRRKERKLVSSSFKVNNQESQELSDEEEEGEQEDMDAMLRWSSPSFEYSSSRRSGNANLSHPKPIPERRTKSETSMKKDSSRPTYTRRLSVGQVAQPSQVEEPSSRADALIKIARLREGDGAWVKRSDDIWTYATLKARENGPDASLEFTVNDRGSSKKFPVTHWAKFVRPVAEIADVSDSESEDDEIGLMMSDPQLMGACPADKATKNTKRGGRHEFSKSLQQMESYPADKATKNTKRGGRCEFSKSLQLMESCPADKATKNKERGGRYMLAKSLDTFASEPTTGSANSLPSKDSSSRGGNKEKGGVFVLMDQMDHDVSMNSSGLHDLNGSMYTLGLQDDDVSVEIAEFQDNFCPSIQKCESTSKGEKSKHRVSFQMPDDEGLTTSFRSSLTSVSVSSLGDFDADAEETCASDVRKDAIKGGKISQRSRSLPQPPTREQNKEHNKSPKGQPPRQIPPLKQVSRSEELGQIKDKVKIVTKKPATKKPKANGSNMPKEKVKERNMGGKQDSFFSALKSMHKRSPVMVPPTSSAS